LNGTPRGIKYGNNRMDAPRKILNWEAFFLKRNGLLKGKITWLNFSTLKEEWPFLKWTK